MSPAPVETAPPPPAATAPTPMSPAPVETAPPPPAKKLRTEEPRGRLVVGADACKTDADCAPSLCCHATACGARSKAPTCTGWMCTQQCVDGTIDCGGGCLCHEGKCAARMVQ